jgi:hypothetical protein
VKQDEFLQFPQAHGRIMSKNEKKVKSFFRRAGILPAHRREAGNWRRPSLNALAAHPQAKTTV